LERSLAFHGRLAGDEVLYADIFVEVGPVNTLAGADETPVAPLLGTGVQESGVPGERGGDRPAVAEVHRKGVLADGSVQGVDIAVFKTRSTHSNLSAEDPRSPRPVFGSAGSRAAKISGIEEESIRSFPVDGRHLAYILR
jgi:hypothetical protein